MTFDAYWQSLTKATPQLGRDDGSMRMSVASSKLQLARAFQAGMDSVPKCSDELFEQLFPGARKT